MPDHRSRMVEELWELDQRIGKLHQFLDTDRYGCLQSSDQLAMLDQLNVMIQYRRILSGRVARAFSTD